jgi:hypothetical protein
VIDNPRGMLLADYFRSLERQLTSVKVSDVPRVSEMTRSMIAACMVPSQDRIAAARGSIAATVFDRARHHINENLRSPALTPQQLCRTLGVFPS